MIIPVSFPFPLTAICFLSGDGVAGLSPGTSSASASMVSNLLSTTLKKLPHLEEPDAFPGAAIAHTASYDRRYSSRPQTHSLEQCELFVSLYITAVHPYRILCLECGFLSP